MKTYLLSILLLALPAAAKDLTFAWNASTTPGVENYCLRAFSGSPTNVVAQFNAGPGLTVTATNVPVGTFSWFVVAQKGNVESDPSNVVVVEVPAPPVGARTVQSEYSLDLTNWNATGQTLFIRTRAVTAPPPIPK